MAKRALYRKADICGAKGIQFGHTGVNGRVNPAHSGLHRVYGRIIGILVADGEGFEPSVDLRLRLISSQVHSTALPPIRTRVL